MSVRVYDLAKKFNLPSKQVLEEAQKRGIKAKVPSSAIDKITAEWFETELINAGFKVVDIPKPEPPPPAPPPPTTVEQPKIVVEPTPVVVPAPVAEVLTPKPTVVIMPAAPAQPIPAASSGRFTPSAQPATTFKPVASPTRQPTVTVPTAPKPTFFRPGSRQTSRITNHGPTMSNVAESTPKPPAQQFEKTVRVKPPIVVKDLATVLGLKPFQLIQELMAMNVFANLTQTIDDDLARQVAARHQISLDIERRERGTSVVAAPKKLVVTDEDRPEDLLLRPPVVTIMGHVDHGKTSLLDRIRSSNVVAGEAGGITQHIGAYTISVKSGGQDRRITFLDTPGHEAFAKMRARGANITDIAVLVVGADDGVQPQTIESINHARAANVPIIVALNKIDKPNADAMRVKKQLQQHNLAAEDWGGQTIVCEVSATEGTGIDHLLEMILLQSDTMDLRANPKRKASGTIVEASLEPGRGPVSTFLIRNGTLHLSDALIAGLHWGKVRAMTDQSGQRLQEAAPSTAVEVIGLNGVPDAGVEFAVLSSDKEARDLAEERALAARATKQNAAVPRVTLENLFAQIAAGQQKELKIILKADMQGSAEAITESLGKLPTDKVRLTVIHAATGNITENDVLLASASNAVIVGFHIRPESGINDIAATEGVEIRLYTIIYELIEEMRKAQEGLLEPLLKEVVIGHAEIRQVFELSKGIVAGCVVTDGRIVKNGRVRLLRRGMKEYEGGIGTLRRFQDDTGEVRAGLECGLRLADFTDYKTGDVIECYTVEKVAQKL